MLAGTTKKMFGGKQMAKVIMIQGTMSNAGKSFLTAGLCRIFVQDGYQTAPFKSQNMALNSFITEDGLEMGRAQVVQAEACKKKPSVFMNPILLKPTTDMGSQVIVNGKVIGNMKAKEYFTYKKELIPIIKEAFEKLAEENDIIVVEGAGSPAEINLKENDIVNMGLAELLDAPVILAGDIDRGGVFAQLAGTMLLLEEKERARIKGFFINKFRGDISILEPGLKMIEEITKKPVLGVIPYADIELEEEDSQDLKQNIKQEKAMLKIAVIQYPRISNFTDFYPLEKVDGVSVFYIKKPSELKNADIIILPGTKSTMADLLWMRQNGLEAAVKKMADAKIPIMGICGGYQMLGEILYDGIESEKKELKGMGLLAIKTIFQEEKTTKQATYQIEKLEGFWRGLSGIWVTGYEIHAGVSRGIRDENRSYFAGVEQKKDGYVSETILGTYLHGIFENTEFTEKFLKILLKQKGKENIELQNIEIEAYKEEQYEKLAEIIRKNINIKEIYKSMGIEKV